ncbi:hypothetical protein F511_24329 [Dorcoceras hygrometricum]|uniref:Uncharacterized protein n=1 Tax=Dorcoceras hygrometricum TaxID=472368 RepID=A0A2Z7ART8_9LAMI|nr:hypothetical protein F511_24329 [Dorcoceras hygrometricum]
MNTDTRSSSKYEDTALSCFAILALGTLCRLDDVGCASSFWLALRNPDEGLATSCWVCATSFTSHTWRNILSIVDLCSSNPSTVHHEFLRRFPVVSGHCLIRFEVALDFSRKAPLSYTRFGGCCGLEHKHEVAGLARAFRSSGNPGFTAGRGFNPAGGAT